MKTEDMKSLFERAVTEKLSDADAVLLMKTVKLPLGYFPAVQEAIRQGRWRRKENEVGYVRTVAKVEAVKGGWEDLTERIHLIIPRVDDEGKLLTHDGYIELLQSRSEGTYKSLGVWHHISSDYDSDDDFDEDGNRLSRRERLYARVPAACRRFGFFPDWERIGRAAGLDADESYVLSMRAMGISRDRWSYLASHRIPCCGVQFKLPKVRAKVLAAWRRFDRKRCMDRVRVFLNKTS